jgi:glycogen debranching enzyme
VFKKTLRFTLQAVLLPLILSIPVAQAKAQTEPPFRLHKFALPSNPIEISRHVRKGIYFDAAGRRSAILGIEEGRFEAWVYPMKLFHDCRLTVSIEGGDANIDLSAYAKRITARPESVTITYSHPQFTIRETIFSPIDDAGSILLFDVDSSRALTLMTSFVPDLKPMWPGGLGGQYAAWSQEQKYFILSESRRKFNGLVGSPLAASGSSTPAHMLAAGGVHFEIKIDPNKARREFIPIIITGNTDGRAKCIEQYKSLSANIEPLYQKTVEHYRKLREERTSVVTPDKNYNLAFEWAKIALDKGLVANPHLGTGLIAGLGLSTDSARPGFGWFFGGDAFINSFAINGYGDFEMMRLAYKFLQKYQRQDGKIMHELSQSGGLIRWFEEFPYGYYHADTTPLYLVSFNEYLLQSGDTQMLKESWESLKKAYVYCLSADTNGDGLMENTVAGLGASELGSLQENLLTDILLGSATVKAMQSMARMAELMNDAPIKQEAQARFERGLATLQNGYYQQASGLYIFALTTKGQNPELTSWPAVALALQLIDASRAELTLQTLAANEISTDWGTRMLANTSSAYDPIAYNNGGVWPFLTGFVALGEYEYHHAISGFHHLMQTGRLMQDDALGFSSEIWSGDYYRPLDTSVPHQLFSSGMIVSPFIRGLMGFKGHEQKKQLTIAPQLPAVWEALEVKRYRLGNELFSVSLRKANGNYKATIEKQTNEPYEIRFAPSFAPFTKIQAVSVEGKPAPFKMEESSQDDSVVVNARMNRRLEIEIKYAAGLEIEVPLEALEIGQRTTGLKFLGVERGKDHLNFVVEGVGGRSYRLKVLSAAREVKIIGARLVSTSGQWRELEVSFSESEAGVYGKKRIHVALVN